MLFPAILINYALYLSFNFISDMLTSTLVEQEKAGLFASMPPMAIMPSKIANNSLIRTFLKKTSYYFIRPEI